MAVVIEVEMVMLINQVTNTRKIQTAHPSPGFNCNLNLN